MLNEITIIQRRARARCALPCRQNYYNLRQYITTIRGLAYEESADINSFNRFPPEIFPPNVAQKLFKELTKSVLVGWRKIRMKFPVENPRKQVNWNPEQGGCLSIFICFWIIWPYDFHIYFIVSYACHTLLKLTSILSLDPFLPFYIYIYILFSCKYNHSFKC